MVILIIRTHSHWREILLLGTVVKGEITGIQFHMFVLIQVVISILGIILCRGYIIHTIGLGTFLVGSIWFLMDVLTIDKTITIILTIVQKLNEVTSIKRCISLK